jgi:hypothetical protein
MTLQIEMVLGVVAVLMVLCAILLWIAEQVSKP